jgi:hypothetical protein
MTRVIIKFVELAASRWLKAQRDKVKVEHIEMFIVS